eukprot:TRINITY_DN67791_c8_g2_i1.p1 TRINITY_DN67791_c8_g2~~TRINITY_DN67791_c8_g2_i1.p1  ORF type:complete len:313 (+),score=43.25 TRINITY_DN67791_c8_g2_i1:65-1003(+)
MTVGKKYCVLVDATEKSLAAAALCAHMVKKDDEVVLNTVIPLYAYHRVPPPHKTYEGAAQYHLARAAAYFKPRKCTIRTHIEVANHVRTAIEKYLEEAQPDVVFVGCRGFGEIRGTLGSVSHHVLHHYEKGAICVVQPDNTDMAPSTDTSVSKHYLLAVDGCEHAKRATKLLAKLVKPQDRVTCFAAIESPAEFVAKLSGPDSTEVEYEENKELDQDLRTAESKAVELAEEAKARILAKNKNLEEDQVMGKGIVIKKHAGKAITAFVEEPANNVDVVVMGTRGRGLIKRMVLGSVSTAVLHGTHKKACLIVP